MHTTLRPLAWCTTPQCTVQGGARTQQHSAARCSAPWRAAGCTLRDGLRRTAEADHTVQPARSGRSDAWSHPAAGSQTRRATCYATARTGLLEARCAVRSLRPGRKQAEVEPEAWTQRQHQQMIQRGPLTRVQGGRGTRAAARVLEPPVASADLEQRNASTVRDVLGSRARRALASRAGINTHTLRSSAVELC